MLLVLVKVSVNQEKSAFGSHWYNRAVIPVKVEMQMFNIDLTIYFHMCHIGLDKSALQ